MLAPKIIGIDIRNENFKAVFSFRPDSKPREIVVPEREIPGNSAKIWDIPIRREFFGFSFDLGIFRFRDAIISRMPVIENPRVVMVRLLKMF